MCVGCVWAKAACPFAKQPRRRVLGRSTHPSTHERRESREGKERMGQAMTEPRDFSVTLRNERGQGLSDTREQVGHSASRMGRWLSPPGGNPARPLAHFNNTHPPAPLPKDRMEKAKKGWECRSGRVVEWEKGACV